MELIPIIENSLLIFIGVLIVVVLFSYISFKFGNKASGKNPSFADVRPAGKNLNIKLPQHDNSVEEYARENSNQTGNFESCIPHSYIPPKQIPMERESKYISKRFVVVNDLAQETTFSAVHRRI